MPRPPASTRNPRPKEADSTLSGSITREKLNNSTQGLAELALSSPSVPAVVPTPATASTSTPRRRTRQSDPKVAALRAIQPPLFSINNKGELVESNVDVPALTSHSTLDVARWWFRSHLEQLNRPKNTIASYMYDLVGFEEISGSKSLDKINRDDVATFLNQSQKKSTRKRRLTSLGAFFKYLIQIEKILDRDPTDNFYADFVPLKTPTVLDHNEQNAILEAARQENVRTFLMIYFMLRLGFTRTELLAIQPEHVNIADPQNPRVYVYYDDARWSKKQRELKPDSTSFVPAFQRYLSEFQPGRKLFEMLPQSVNKLVERVAREANINKKVTPQSLRDTFAVEEARAGGNVTHLLNILGLAPDPRNKMSVDRYIKLASRSGPLVETNETKKESA
jgi:integrase/recombinase XerD